MRSWKHPLTSVWALIILTAMVVSTARPGFAQDAGQASGKDNPSPQDTAKQTDNATSEPASPIGLAWANSYIHQIGNAGLLAGSREGIGWGSLYIPTASASGIVDQFGATSTSPSASFTAAILQTTVVYDHRFQNSRFAVQYTPSMAIANGQIVGDFSNQNTTLDFLIYTRPRWNVRFSDSFTYDYTQRGFGFPFFDVNPTSGGTFTSSFLNGPFSHLMDSANLTIAYALSRRSSISVTPGFTYSESGATASLIHATAYGGSASWNYRTSERQSVGLQYSGSLIHETLPASSNIPASDTLYHTIAGITARQLSPTLIVSGSAGVTTYSSALVTLNQRQWSFYGSFGVQKQLKHASLGLQYSRGDTLSIGLISSQFADRVDATYRSEVIRRFGWMMGGGYLRQVGTSAFSAWYATSEARFLLAPRAGLFSFFNFTHNKQGNNAINLNSGNQDFYSFGIRWQPSRVAH